MEQSNKELIKEIADLFEDYEESYVPGEWEAFQKQKKKKYQFLTPWLKVAAVLLLIASVLPFGVKKLQKSPEQQNVPPVLTEERRSNEQALSATLQKEEKVSGDKNKANVYHEKKAAALQTNRSGNLQIAAAADPVSQGSNGIVSSPTNAGAADFSTVNQILAQNQVKAAHTGVPLKDSIAVPAKAKLSTSEFLIAESKKAPQKDRKKAVLSKWDFGLEVVPTATRSTMNFGGGLVTAYHISDKLSLSSGINLVQLGSNEHVAQTSSLMSAEAASFSNGKATGQGSKELLTVAANIKAIDIPLGLVYRVNKHYYTSAGVSYFNVLSEKRNNTYSETVPVSRMSTDPVTGAVQSYSALETQQVDEPTTDKPLKGNGYLGFFNFSVGRRQNIFRQYNIQIEPFIKVPIGKLSAQDLNLMNSGVKFQLSF